MNPANDNISFVSFNEAVKITSLSRTMINRLRAAGSFPVPVALGERRIGFVRHEIQQWIADRVAARAA